MGNFTNICQDVRNLTCRPRDNLTFRKELERQCHMQMLILLFVAFAVGCLLAVSVRAINKYWCSSRRRRVFRPIPERRSNRSDHYVTSIIGGITPPQNSSTVSNSCSAGRDTYPEMISVEIWGSNTAEL